MSVDKLFNLFGIDPVKDKRKYRRCQRKFLAVKYEDGAVRFYGSYNVRCRQPLTECVNCRHWINVNLLVPAVEVEEYGLKEAMRRVQAHGVAERLYNKYVLANLDEVVRSLEEGEEVRLV